MLTNSADPNYRSSTTALVCEDNINAWHPYYDTLGTLGDDDDSIGLTCSLDAARNSRRATKIFPFPTFEAAAEAVKNGTAMAMLVPGAYPSIRLFIMDPNLRVNETFIRNIPPLVLVGLIADMPSAVDCIYHHPATEQLLPEIGVTYAENRHVSSNTQACVQLLKHGGLALAITNALCSTHYELSVLKVLRAGIAMPWVIFTKK